MLRATQTTACPQRTADHLISTSSPEGETIGERSYEGNARRACIQRLLWVEKCTVRCLDAQRHAAKPWRISEPVRRAFSTSVLSRGLGSRRDSGDRIPIFYDAYSYGRPALRIIRSRPVNRSIVSMNCSLPAGRQARIPRSKVGLAIAISLENGNKSYAALSDVMRMPGRYHSGNSRHPRNPSPAQCLQSTKLVLCPRNSPRILPQRRNCLQNRSG